MILIIRGILMRHTIRRNAEGRTLKCALFAFHLINHRLYSYTTEWIDHLFKDLFDLHLFTSEFLRFRYYVEPSYYQRTEAEVYHSYTTTTAPSYYVAPISYSTAVPSSCYSAETYSTDATLIYYSEAPK